MLRRIELEILATVERGDTISELATKLDHSESYLSRAVRDLFEKGLAYTERDGRRKQVVPSDAWAVELYKDLVRQHSHIDFPELLTGKALEVLYYFDQPRSVTDISERSNNYLDILPAQKGEDSRPPLGYCGLRRGLFSRCKAATL